MSEENKTKLVRCPEQFTPLFAQAENIMETFFTDLERSPEQGDIKIELYFRDGELFHAKSNDLEGQSAFFAAMASLKGRFYFDETGQIPTEKTIDGNTQFLILEALRQIDEESVKK